MGKRNYLQELYKFDKEKNSYIIEVSLDDYDDVYDDWDPSPFKKRDIETEFNDFILDSSSDIPLKYHLEIHLYLPEGLRAEFKEKALISAYRNNFLFLIGRTVKAKTGSNKKIVTYLILALCFLFVGYFYTNPTGNIFYKVLKEGIFVGGWVFLWEVFTLVFITSRDFRRELKVYKRLLDADIEFIYKA